MQSKGVHSNQIMTEAKTETKLGSNCSLTDGVKNRILTLANTGITHDDGLSVIVGYSGLANGVDFTISHANTGSTITFLNEIFDTQSIVVNYQQDRTTSTLTSMYTSAIENFDGSDCTGIDSASNRTLTLTNATMTQSEGFMVFVSGLALSLTNDYTISHKSNQTVITFLNPIFDDSLIIVNYYQEKEGDTTVPSTGNDFVDGPLTDLGVTVVRTPVTVTKSNMSGQKTYTDGNTNDLTAVFVNPNQNFALDKSGLTEVFDGKLFVRASETITKYDKITYNSNTYRVDKVTLRKFGSTNMFKAVILLFID